MEQTLFILTVALGFLLAFVTGFHDGGNVIAASVLSRSLSPHTALGLACLAEFVGPLILGTAVAATICKEVLNPVYLDPALRMIAILFLLSGLLSAVAWNLMTWWVGIPSSSTHALIGGLLGGGVAAFGLGIVNWLPLITLVAVPLLIAPAAGLLFGYLVMMAASRYAGGAPSRANNAFKRMQFVSVLLLGAGHGTNSAQKAMAVITLTLLTTGSLQEFEVPVWVVLGCASSLVLGVSLGGWKIVKIRSNKVYKIEAVHSFVAQAASGAVIMGASLFGSPIGTMSTVKSAILGVGVGTRGKRPGRLVVKDLVAAWVITTPACASLAAAVYWTAAGALGQGMGIFGGIMRTLGQ